MTTKSICPRAHGEGSLGKENKAWGDVRTAKINGMDAGVIAAPRVNLLANSTFDACSAGTPVGVGAERVANGDCEAITGWNSYREAALTVAGSGDVGNCIRINEGASANPGMTQTITGLVPNRLYIFKWKHKWSAGNTTVKAGIGSAAGATNLGECRPGGHTMTSSWASGDDVIFRAPSNGTVYPVFYNLAGGGGSSSYYIDSVFIQELGVGFTAADNKAPDGWTKDTTLAVTRQYSDKDGVLYELVLGGTGSFYRNEYGPQFKGRAQAFGKWVWCDTANAVRLSIYDGTASSNSAYHSGNSTWEWLEVAHTCTEERRQCSVYVASAANVKVAHPMCVFGSSIGEGNYQPAPQQRLVFAEMFFSKKFFSTSSWSSTPSLDFDIGIDSEGRIGDGVKHVLATGSCRDSGSSGTSTVLTLITDQSPWQVTGSVDCTGQGNDTWGRWSGVIDCAPWKSYPYSVFQVSASGSNTFDTELYYRGVIA